MAEEITRRMMFLLSQKTYVMSKHFGSWKYLRRIWFYAERPCALTVPFAVMYRPCPYCSPSRTDPPAVTFRTARETKPDMSNPPPPGRGPPPSRAVEPGRATAWNRRKTVAKIPLLYFLALFLAEQEKSSTIVQILKIRSKELRKEERGEVSKKKPNVKEISEDVTPQKRAKFA